MLYAWLAERDDMRFERAFEKYYEAAFMGVVRYLAHRSTSADLDFEQIAVDALLKFFSRVGRERRVAAESIASALPRIEPLDFGPYHVRLVRRWAGDIGSFRQTTMAFSIDECDAGRDWKAEIDVLTRKIPPLQRQGCHILEPLRAAIAGGAKRSAAADGSGHAFEETAGEEPFIEYALVREFAAGLRSDSEAARAHPGALRFVEGTWTVIEALPLLRVPTNGYLFDIAQSLYLDECKARGRLKRGGSGIANPAGAPTESNSSNDGLHPLAKISLDDDPEAESFRPITMVFAADSADSAVDLESEQVGEEFCEKFYAYLRRPLDVAEEAYRIAATSGPAKAERKRLESVARKTDRVLSVLSMRIEGQTQEAIAEAQGISRNQVKYIVELIQEAYAQFTASCVRTSVRQSTAGDLSHVQ
jgi:DNA-directed RNA polymerase specialized sigma24 family protein